jgi:transcriptional regulator with XRE-family HTH domain
MTSLRKLLAFNMKERRRALRLSQAALAERVGSSTHYIGMIEMERQFPAPEMLERIAGALEIDSPELFSMAAFPSASIKRFQEAILSDMGKLIDNHLKDLTTTRG